MDQRNDTIFLDLESPRDLLKLSDPEFFLGNNSDKLICIDEIQRSPELFPVLRVLIDNDRRPGRFLILGSASHELIKQSSESLAGRINYHELTPFLEIETHKHHPLQRLWMRGGFPESIKVLNLHHVFVVTPKDESFAIAPKISLCGLHGIAERVKAKA